MLIATCLGDLCVWVVCLNLVGFVYFGDDLRVFVCWVSCFCTFDCLLMVLGCLGFGWVVWICNLFCV